MSEEASQESTLSEPTFLQIAKPIFLGWERIRLVYLFVNGLLCIALLMSSEPTPDQQLEFWLICLAGGFVANVCYFAGPVVESYAAWLGFGYHKWLRPILFILGTLFTLLAAASVLASLLFPFE
jgi:hypothetical protein